MKKIIGIMMCILMVLSSITVFAEGETNLEVVSTNFVNGATNICDDIEITFNLPLDTGKITTANKTGCVKLISTHRVNSNKNYSLRNNFSFEYLNENKTLVIPVKNLLSDTEYTLTLPVSTNFSSSTALKLEVAVTYTFTTGTIDQYGQINDNAKINNLILGKTPIKSNGTWTNSVNDYTNGKFYVANNVILTPAEGEFASVTYDLGSSYNIYSVDIGVQMGYSTTGNEVYGSNDVNNLLGEKLVGPTAKIQASSTEEFFKRFFTESEKKYRYITVRNGTAGNKLTRITEIAVNGSVTTTLEEQNYEMTEFDISKNADGDIVATTNVINKDAEATSTSPLFILALYNEAEGAETLVATATAPADSVVVGAVKNITATIPASELTGKTYTRARLFAFDNTTNLTPICKPLAVNIAN